MAALLAATGPLASAQTWQTEIDFIKLKSRLGGQTPTGAGVVVSMVEGTAPGTGASYVDVTNPEFNGTFDPNQAAVQFTDESGKASLGQSNHALGVARHFFGDLTSIAPGANQAALYEAGHWLSNGAIHYNTNAQPELEEFRVQNHSWVLSTLGTASQDQSALRRFDWIVDTDDMTAVVGANNASAANLATHPNLLIHSYNAIVVGRTDGFHSRGAAGAVYGTGRFKPDIVAPFTVTSHATPVVGSVAALLHESGAGTDAVKSETMKATLMAGATKQEFANFLETMPAVPSGAPSLTPKPWDRTPTRPLDDIFGAGELNVYNSYLIQQGGQHAGSVATPTTTAGSYGWDYKGKTAANELFYNFEVAEGSTAEELSIILAWNAKITDTTPAPGAFTPVESLQNLDLRLYTSNENVLSEPLDPLRTSISTVDNVEHIYLTDLDPGTYTLKVSGAADWDYGLAWRMSTKFDEVSADFNEDGVVDGTDFLTWQRNLGTLLGAAHGDGDADGDGDVDEVDLQAVKDGLMPITPPLLGGGGAAAAIPEPAGLALAALALLAAAGLTWRRHGRG